MVLNQQNMYATPAVCMHCYAAPDEPDIGEKL